MSQISIIIPNYNHAKYLPQRLESVYDQTYQDFEVILLDDCSNDDSIAILNTYAKHPKTSHVVFNDKNSGSTFKQWAKGLALAKGEFIWIAESDDIADLNFLEVSIKYLKKYNKVGILNVRSQIIDANGQHIKCQNNLKSTKGNSIITLIKGDIFAQNHMINSNSIINVSACLIRKKYLENINFSAINLKLNGDWLIYIYILLESDILLCNEVLNKFRTHSNSVRSNITKLENSLEEWYSLQQILLNQNIFKPSLIRKSVYNPLFGDLNYYIENKKYIKAYQFMSGIATQFKLSRILIVIKYIRYYFFIK
tara:strand:+ start:2054 stop:2983 length:930 start_codon:yes stop_codon:yes gene_type:complete